MENIDEYVGKIVNHYQELSTKVERNVLFGVIINNTKIEGTFLSEHPKGLAITSKVLNKLYPPEVFEL